MKVVNNKIVGKLREYYNVYYKKNDEAHNLDHIDEVYREMVRINKLLDLRINQYIIMITAYMHDIMVWKSRKHHHKLGSILVMYRRDRYLNKLTKDERKLIADAIYEHRSSGSGKHSSTLSELLATADKGKPDIRVMIPRSYKYHITKKPTLLQRIKRWLKIIDKEAAEAVKNHLHEKFGSKGYIKYPDMYRKIYGEEITKLQQEVDNITTDKVVRILKEVKW